MKINGGPSITVGMIVLNREWVIGKALNSVMSQTYPHDKIFVLIVDGESTDRTVEVAKEVLEKSDFGGYDIIVKKSNVAEAKNICIEKARGDLLLFWDSDIIMEPNAIYMLLDTMKKQNADIVSGHASFVYAKSQSAIDASVEEAMVSQVRESTVQEVCVVGMGHTFISRKVLDSDIRFDPALAVCDDQDFSGRLGDRGFKMVIDKRIRVVDINILNMPYSDMQVDARLEDVMRAMRKKARAQVLACRPFWTLGGEIRFFWSNKRYLFYFGYILAMILTGIGIFVENPLLIAVFPAYLLLYASWQMMRRGARRGAKMVLRSFLVGIPWALWMIFYYSGYVLRKKLGLSSKER